MTTPVPEKATKEHLSSIKRLAYEEDADLFVPVTSPLHSIYEARGSSPSRRASPCPTSGA